MTAAVNTYTFKNVFYTFFSLMYNFTGPVRNRMQAAFTEATKQNDDDVTHKKMVQPKKGSNAPGKDIYSEQF